MVEPRRYAEGTDVSAEKSRAELEALLRRHGANEFAIYTSDTKTIFQYRVHDRMIRHTIEVPDPKSFQKKPAYGTRQLKPDQLQRAADAELRRRWRALVLVCKAKLEIIASKGSTFEREFLSDMLLPNGETIGASLAPRIAEAYATGQMPKSLLMLGPGGADGL